MKINSRKKIIKNIRLIKNDAMTLTELLIATALVAIIMLGVVSVDYAMRQSKASVVEGSRLSIDLQSAFLQISRDAMLAVGDDGNPGIYIYSPAATTRNLCFRYDDNSPVTPDNFADDDWVCYYHDDDYLIKRCPDSTNLPITNDGDCASWSADFSLQLSDASFQYFTLPTDANGNFLSLELDIETRQTWDEPYHPIKNPQSRLQTHVNPPGITRKSFQLAT